MFIRRYLNVLMAVSILFVSSLCQSPINQVEAYSETPSRLRSVIEKFAQDNGAINRLFTAQVSDTRGAKLRQLYADNLASLGQLNFDSLSHDEQIDYILFSNYLRHEIK